MHYLRILIIVVISFAIVGCAWNKHKYRGTDSQIQSMPPLTIPENLTSLQLENYYPIPPVIAEQPTGELSLLPPGSKIEEYAKKK